jgi:hypothetical protein
MTSRARTGWLALGALLLGAAWLCALRAGSDAGETRAGRARDTPAAPLRAVQLSRPALEQLLSAARQAPAPDHAHERPPDGRPHPVTPEHLRLYRDVDLLRAAEAAIRTGRYDEARALVAQHRRELHGMSAPEEEGLLLLADCAEQRSPDNVARVRRFYDQHTDSMLRRRLRRSCLERAQ